VISCCDWRQNLSSIVLGSITKLAYSLCMHGFQKCLIHTILTIERCLKPTRKMKYSASLGVKNQNHRFTIWLYYKNVDDRSDVVYDNELLSAAGQVVSSLNCPSPSSLGQRNSRPLVADRLISAGFGGYFTNHSLHATSATRMFDAGIDEQHRPWKLGAATLRFVDTRESVTKIWCQRRICCGLQNAHRNIGVHCYSATRDIGTSSCTSSVYQVIKHIAY
jgi:hypothetical protein